MAEPANGHANRITVSQEVLRLELENQALRIVSEVNSKLEMKANAIDLQSVRDRLNRVEMAVEVSSRGREFTASETRQIQRLISDERTTSTQAAWSSREKIMGVILFIMSLASFYLSAHGGHL